MVHSHSSGIREQLNRLALVNGLAKGQLKGRWQLDPAKGLTSLKNLHSTWSLGSVSRLITAQQTQGWKQSSCRPGEEPRPPPAVQLPAAVQLQEQAVRIHGK